MTPKLLLQLFFVVLFISCSTNEITNVTEPDEQLETELKKPNILLIIADDFGLDACPGYDIGALKPYMPTIESLSSRGITFSNFWSNPVCTPTRSTILTGKYGFRTNVLNVEDELSTSEASIHEFLGVAYSNAVIGKWHLSKDLNHPNEMGIDYYAGSISGGLRSYLDWVLVENGEETSITDYNTSKYSDLAIDWVSQQSNPWFLWLAFNAPHSPFHLPPTELHYQGILPEDQSSIDANPLPYYFAMLEAMDTEIGRLLNSLTTAERENTVVIFIGDNGTPGGVIQEYNTRRGKGSLFNGGINVPLIVSGKGVDRIGVMDNSFINSTDIFATIANIGGIHIDEINDSQNFSTLFYSNETHQRDFLYSETGEDMTVRNNTHKYILKQDGTEYLFNLSLDPLESENLMHTSNLPLSLEDEEIKNELVAKLAAIRN